MPDIRFGVWRFARAFLLLFAVLSLVPNCFAQAVAVAEVGGVITDNTGAAIAGAEVKIIETEKQIVRNTNSDPQGRYTLPNLPVGPYRLEVTAAGFKSYVQSGILLQVGNNVQINVTMQVGAISEHVEVTAGAAMVETRENTDRAGDRPAAHHGPAAEWPAGHAVDPALGRRAANRGGGMVGSKNYYSSTTISVAGGQANGINYLLDGGDHNDAMTNVNMPFPFPDALQEFSVETSALPARFGLHPGAVVNVVTKSGANDWHGDLFEFLRNGNFNARNIFAAAHDTLKRNQFGGTFGGQIIRDKLFFFGGYPGHRRAQRSAADRQLCANRSGDERRFQRDRFRRLRRLAARTAR